MYGAIEAGGTKFVCCVADENHNIVDRVTIETKDPDYTLGETIKFFKDKDIASFGVAIFGPVVVDKKREDYGKILNTPKTKWINTNVYKILKESLGVPINIETDVNAAALSEYLVGLGEDKNSVLYITIGTGIGAGYVLGGKIINGVSHPEMGHILIRPREDDFEGACPYHGNCLEGLASGKSIEMRLGKKGATLPKDHYIWDMIADYIAQALISYTMILSPEIIILGGGVSRQEQLFDKIRNYFKQYMNGYLSDKRYGEDIESYIKYPKHGQDAGLLGAIFLAEKGIRNEN